MHGYHISQYAIYSYMLGKLNNPHIAKQVMREAIIYNKYLYKKRLTVVDLATSGVLEC